MTQSQDFQPPHNPFARMTNLADARIGAEAIHCTDDFFADMSRMLQTHDPVWKEGVYDDNGKWSLMIASI
tara:strand:+ start:1186 stop:1395 length:210 start_codon:yes stop_codon:yes gene_type:complete